MADFDRHSIDLTSSSPKQPENEMSLGSPQNPEAGNGASTAPPKDGEGPGLGSPEESHETPSQKQVREVLASDVRAIRLLHG